LFGVGSPDLVGSSHVLNSERYVTRPSFSVCDDQIVSEPESELPAMAMEAVLAKAMASVLAKARA